MSEKQQEYNEKAVGVSANTPKSQKRVALYVRVSTEEQATDGYWEPLQISKMMSYIDVRDKDYVFAWERYIYRDVPVSWADAVDDRPGLKRLFDDVELSPQKPFDVVMVYKIDRFARRLSVLLDISDRLKACKLDFVSASESFDTDSPFGKAMFWMLWVFAELERDMIHDRTSAWRRESLSSWTWLQPRQYGYLKNNDTGTVQVIEEEARVIQRIYELLVYEGMWITTICRYLSDQHILIPTVATRPLKKNTVKDPYAWQDKTVRGILQNEVYIWNYYYNKQKSEITDYKRNKKRIISIPKEQWILSSMHHQPIVSEELFWKAQEIMEDKRGLIDRKDTYLLSWLLKCDACKKHNQRWMLSWTGIVSHGTRLYQCCWKGIKYKYQCNAIGLNQGAMDKFVKAEIRKLVQKPELLIEYIKKNDNLVLMKESLDRRTNECSEEIVRLEQAEYSMKEMVKRWHLTAEQFEKDLAHNNKRIAQLEEELVGLRIHYKDFFDVQAQVNVLQHISLITNNLEEIFENDVQCKRLFKMIIDEIIVYADKNDKLRLPWPAKKVQLIPHTIVIKFKLPQDFLTHLFSTQDVEEVKRVHQEYNLKGIDAWDMLLKQLGYTWVSKERLGNDNNSILKLSRFPVHASPDGYYHH